jgi:hypothetical protein
MELRTLEGLMKQFGYTRKNLYTKENRTPIKLTKIISKDFSDEYTGRDVEEMIYVTKYYGENIPDNIVIVINMEDERFLLKTDKDLYN